MPGSLDAQGVYQYAESDLAAPFSSLLNKLAGSVSSGLGDDRTRLAALESAAWITYTPTSAGITLGNGTLVGRYKLIGKMCTGRIRFIAGSTTTFTATTLLLGVPLGSSLAPDDVLGSAFMLDASTGSPSRTGGVFCATGIGGYVVADHGAADAARTVTNLVPWTWATSDKLNVNFTYKRRRDPVDDAARNLAVLGFIAAAPIAIIVVVGLLRGYRFDLRMTREGRGRRRKDDDEDDDGEAHHERHVP